MTGPGNGATLASAMSLEPDDAAARLAYFMPWTFEGACGCLPDKSKPLLCGFVCHARLYVLFSQLFSGDHAHEALEMEWPGIARKLRASYDAASAARPPGLLERLAGDTRAALREQMVQQTKQACLDHWRTGGRNAQAAKTSWSNVEVGTAAMVEPAMRNPGLSDAQLVSQGRALFMGRMSARTDLPFSRADLTEFVGTYITADGVAEARRRARECAVGQVLTASEAKWKAEGMTPDEIATGRIELINTLLK